MNDTNEEYNAFEQKMHNEFPKIFSSQYGGFAIDKGWWPIVESLCANIQRHIDWKQTQKEKYNLSEGCEQVVAVQIKEKFGGLRFYYNGGDDTVDGMVRMAEAWAYASCQACGAPGKLRSGDWVRTLCDHHEEEYQRKRKERFGTDKR